MKAVIMAGGKGTRLTSINVDIPKPMFPIFKKPILEYQIESLKRSGVEDITIIVGHLKETVMDYFGDGRQFAVNIDYIEENEPLGTGGALYYLKLELEDFILVFGDLIFDIDFKRFMEYHKIHNAAITLFGHPNSHPFDSDIIETDETGKVIRILNKNIERNFYYHNFVNAGVYCINPKVLESIKCPHKIDLDKTLITEMIERENVYAYRSTEYVKDMGTPERLQSVSEDIQKGIVSERSLRKKQKAVFLGHNGAIDEYVSIDRLVLLPEIGKAIRQINDSAYLAIAIANQLAISEKKISFKELDEIHKIFETELGKEGAYFDDIFLTLDSLQNGHGRKEPGYKTRYVCRESKSEMLNILADRYNIDLWNSWYVSDSMMDIHAGKNAGMRTIFVKPGEGTDEKKDLLSDYVAETIFEAVEYIFRCDMRYE